MSCPHKKPSQLISSKLNYHGPGETYCLYTQCHTLPSLLFILACMTLAMYVTYNDFYYLIYREFGGNQTCFVPLYACALYKYISSYSHCNHFKGVSVE